MKKKIPYQYTIYEKCVKCDKPLIGHHRGFDVCGNCEYAILKRLDASVTCAYCFTERDKKQAPCPRCRLLDMCEAILDDINWPEPQYNHDPLTIKPDLLRHMAAVLYAIRPPQNS